MSSLRHILHKATNISTQQYLVKTSPSLLATQTNLLALQSSPSLLQPSNNVNTQTRQASNRSRRGLYDGKDIRSGNNVSFSNKRTKRKFKPNVFRKRLYSEILDEMIQFHVTTSALRTIDKYGGLDNYLLKNKNVTEGEGWQVKQKLLARMKHYDSIGKDLLPKITLPKAGADKAVKEDLDTTNTGNVMKE